MPAAAAHDLKHTFARVFDGNTSSLICNPCVLHHAHKMCSAFAHTINFTLANATLPVCLQSPVSITPPPPPPHPALLCSALLCCVPALGTQNLLCNSTTSLDLCYVSMTMTMSLSLQQQLKLLRSWQGPQKCPCPCQLSQPPLLLSLQPFLLLPCQTASL